MIVPIGVAACYLALAIAVHLRLLDPLDLAVRSASRPGDAWGRVQLDASGVADHLDPSRVATLLIAGAAAVSVARRTFRPLAAVAVVFVPVAVVVLASKWVMAHSAPDTGPVAHGSFPSGHTVTAVVSVGLLVLLMRQRPRWGWLLPVLAGFVVGTALVLASIHPATDVLGAGLLAAAGLTAASAAGLGEWAKGIPRSDLSEGVR